MQHAPLRLADVALAHGPRQVAALRQDLQDLMASVQSLAGEVRGLSAKLDSMSTAGAALGAAGGGGLDGSGSGAKDGGQAGGVSDAKAALRALVRASKYDEAMKQVSSVRPCGTVGDGVIGSVTNIEYIPAVRGRGGAGAGGQQPGAGDLAVQGAAEGPHLRGRPAAPLAGRTPLPAAAGRSAAFSCC